MLTTPSIYTKHQHKAYRYTTSSLSRLGLIVMFKFWSGHFFHEFAWLLASKAFPQGPNTCQPLFFNSGGWFVPTALAWLACSHVAASFLNLVRQQKRMQVALLNQLASPGPGPSIHLKNVPFARMSDIDFAGAQTKRKKGCDSQLHNQHKPPEYSKFYSHACRPI